MARSQVAYGGDDLHMLRVAANVVMKHGRAATRGGPLNSGIGLGTTAFHP